MIERIKKTDRILLEMHTGILLFGLVCQIGCVFAKGWVLRYSLSLWTGIVLALAGSIHMARSLDRAFGTPEATAKVITSGYVVRYLVLVVAMGTAAVTGVLNPLIMFLGYMSMKVTAYLQPRTDKCYTMLCHETDPVPEPMPEQGESPEGTVLRDESPEGTVLQGESPEGTVPQDENPEGTSLREDSE